MTISKIFRSVFAVILSCVIALNGFTGLAFANSRSTDNSFFETNSPVIDSTVNSRRDDSFIDGLEDGLGGFVGLVVGTIVVCYAVDVIILPYSPQVGLYLAKTCPGIGTAVGTAAKTVLSATANK